MTSRRRQVAMRNLHGSLVELVAQMNLPQRDEALLTEAGITTLDRALFPLLVGIQRFGPIGVGELADRAGRDYTTVSRQVAKLADSSSAAPVPPTGGSTKPCSAQRAAA